MTNKRVATWTLFLAMLLAPSLVAQLPTPTPHAVNYGVGWKWMSDPARLIYIQGFVDGQSATYSALANSIAPASRESLRKQTDVPTDPTALRDTMTELYMDPANAYVSFDVIIYAARDKLSGLDISKRLKDARSAAKSGEK